MHDLIDENEAAMFLGITKELLFAFVKKGVKGKKLTVVANAQNKFFSKQTLLEWDACLKQPWAVSSTLKPEIPAAIREYLKVESGGKCVRCGSGHRLDNAHIDPWSESLSHHPHNLIRLCTDCHTKYDDKIISKTEILEFKQNLITKIRSEILSHVELKNNLGRGIPISHPIFIGRAAELLMLRNLYSSERLIVVEGIGGIGKTQFILQFIKSDKLDVAWFSLEQYDSLNTFKLAIASYFCVSSLDELVEVLDASGITLVLDGFEQLLVNDWDSAAEFLSTVFNHTTKLKIVVTTQIDFSDHSLNPAYLKLGSGLKNDESMSVITKRLPNLHTDDQFLLKLCEFAEGHPLTLVIIAGLIQFMKDAKSVYDAVEDTGITILESPKHKKQTRSTSLEISLATAYNLLEPATQWLFKYFSFFPAGCKTAFLEILSGPESSPFKTKTAVRKSTAILDQFNFLQYYDDKLEFERVSLLNPVKIFVREKLKQESNKTAHEIKLTAHFNLMMEAYILYDKYMLTEDVGYVMNRFDLELPNYLNAFRGAVHSAYCPECNLDSDRSEYLQVITGLAAGLYKYLFTRGLFAEGVYINKEGAKAHVELGEYELAIDDLLQVATYYKRRYDHKGANEVLETILSYEKKAGVRLPHVRTLQGELIKSEDPRKAIEIFKEGVSLCEEGLKQKDRVDLKGNMAMLKGEIGRIYDVYLHDGVSALPYNLSSYEIAKEIKDYGNLNCAAHHLGNAYAGLNDSKNAIKYYKESMIGFVKLGQQQYISNSLSELGKMQMLYREADFTFLNEELLAAGLEDIKREIKLSHKKLEKELRSVNGNLPNEVVFKMWNIIKLVALSKHSLLLKNWVADLLPIFIPISGENGMPSYPIFFLKIAEASLEVEQKKKRKMPLRALKYYCYLFGGEVEHDLFDPYEWLAFWLKVKEISNTSRGELFAEIERY